MKRLTSKPKLLKKIIVNYEIGGRILVDPKMLALFFWFLTFTTALITTLSIAYWWKRNLKKGKMDWKNFHRARSNMRAFLVLGVILAPIGLYCLASDVGVIEMFLRMKVDIIRETLVTGGIFMLGGAFSLGAGLGFGLGSLFFPIKNPTTD